jgi:hypothetical protein
LILKNYFNKRKQEENDQYKSKYRAILILWESSLFIHIDNLFISFQISYELEM